MSKRAMTILTILILLAVGGFLLWWFGFYKKEGFGYDGALTGVALGGNAINTHSIVDPPMSTFADIVAPSGAKMAASSNPAGSCTSLPLPTKAGAYMDNRDLLPDVNTHAVSYDVDVSDPEVFMWRPSVRSSIHNRQQETADPYRGDLPITKTGCGYSNNGWFSSRYNEGDAKLDGFFSEFYNSKFRALTGQKSYPQQIANEGTIMDMSSAPSMDWY